MKTNNYQINWNELTTGKKILTMIGIFIYIGLVAVWFYNFLMAVAQLVMTITEHIDEKKANKAAHSVDKVLGNQKIDKDFAAKIERKSAIPMRELEKCDKKKEMSTADYEKKMNDLLFSDDYAEA